MKPGFVKVSENAKELVGKVLAGTPNKAAGKIRKVRCFCTDDTYCGNNKEQQYFNNGELGLIDQCPVCNAFYWYKV